MLLRPTLSYGGNEALIKSPSVSIAAKAKQNAQNFVSLRAHQ
jgi:hypothetical protein